MKVLITGGTSGIGFNLALKLIKNGHLVYIGVHNKAEIKTTLEKIRSINYQDRVKVIKLNITKKEDIEMIDKLDIDCLVNLASIGTGGSLINMEVNEIRKNFETNFFATLTLIKEYIKTRKNKKGKIIITSSLAGKIPIPFLGSYCATKAALSIFTKILKKEIQKTNKNITIKLIEPGAYNTGFNQYMIEKEEKLKFEDFLEDKECIIKNQKQLFSLLENKKLNSIVNKMYNSITKEERKLIYQAPLLQVMAIKIYTIFSK